MEDGKNHVEYSRKIIGLRLNRGDLLTQEHGQIKCGRPSMESRSIKSAE